jgi:hypothetical protein
LENEMADWLRTIEGGLIYVRRYFDMADGTHAPVVHDSSVLAALTPNGSVTATIPIAGADKTKTAAIDVAGHYPSCITVVGAPTSGYIAFECSSDGTSYGRLKVGGAMVILAAAAGDCIGLGEYASSLYGVTHIKIVNVTSAGAATDQATAAATFVVGRA